MPAPSRAEPFERRCRTGIMAQAYGLSSCEKLEMGHGSRNPASAGARRRSLAAQGPRAVGHSTIWGDGHRVRLSREVPASLNRPVTWLADTQEGSVERHKARGRTGPRMHDMNAELKCTTSHKKQMKGHDEMK